MTNQITLPTVRQIVTGAILLATLITAAGTISRFGKGWLVGMMEDSEEWGALEARVDSLERANVVEESNDRQKWQFHELLPLPDVHRVEQ